MRYPLALALTLVVEVPIYIVALRTLAVSARRAAAVAVCVNLVTHPLVWLAVSHAGAAYWRAFTAAELGAWLAEATMIYIWVRTVNPPVRRVTPVGPAALAALSALVALAANAGSALAGLLLT